MSDEELKKIIAARRKQTIAGIKNMIATKPQATAQMIDMFDPKYLARRNDPETSKIAARNIQRNLSNRRQETLQMLRESDGATAGELAVVCYRRFPERGIRACSQSPQKRLGELEKLDLVRRGQTRKCADTGQTCITWWIK